VGELGAAIAAEYEGRQPLLVAALKAAVVFLADLSRALPIPHEIDFVELAGYGAPQRAATRASASSRTSTCRLPIATS
jgi:hypoxanthine phosphoribosyltransferase